MYASLFGTSGALHLAVFEQPVKQVFSSNLQAHDLSLCLPMSARFPLPYPSRQGISANLSRHPGENRGPELFKTPGFPRIQYGAGCVEHGMTVKDLSDTPQLAAG